MALETACDRFQCVDASTVGDSTQLSLYDLDGEGVLISDFIKSSLVNRHNIATN